jgi:hypothetical protein
MGSAIVLIVSDWAVLCSFEFSLTIEGFTGLDEAGRDRAFRRRLSRHRPALFRRRRAPTALV